jgi:hypothetical protein
MKVPLLALIVSIPALFALSGSTVSAADNIICGESETISVTIRDSAGQPVSDHTRVEFVTSFGGVLGGTGAILDPLAVGYVAPISSTTAETYNGMATAVLITSTEHIGAYEVVVSAGGSVQPRLVPMAPIYAPGGTTPNVASVIPQFNYATTYVPSGPPVTTQITVTCVPPSAS